VLSRMTVPVLYYMSQRDRKGNGKQTGTDFARAN
jgi:hypothetical protein